MFKIEEIKQMLWLLLLQYLSIQDFIQSETMEQGNEHTDLRMRCIQMTAGWTWWWQQQ
jgi:hypothetical protein